MTYNLTKRQRVTFWPQAMVLTMKAFDKMQVNGLHRRQRSKEDTDRNKELRLNLLRLQGRRWTCFIRPRPEVDLFPQAWVYLRQAGGEAVSSGLGLPQARGEAVSSGLGLPQARGEAVSSGLGLPQARGEAVSSGLGPRQAGTYMQSALRQPAQWKFWLLWWECCVWLTSEELEQHRWFRGHWQIVFVFLVTSPPPPTPIYSYPFMPSPSQLISLPPPPLSVGMILVTGLVHDEQFWFSCLSFF